MAEGDKKLQRCGELPVLRPPSSASADCSDLEAGRLRAGATSDWSALPAGTGAVVNPTPLYWIDEETEIFIGTDQGNLIILE